MKRSHNYYVTELGQEEGLLTPYSLCLSLHSMSSKNLVVLKLARCLITSNDARSITRYIVQAGVDAFVYLSAMSLPLLFPLLHHAVAQTYVVADRPAWQREHWVWILLYPSPALI